MAPPCAEIVELTIDSEKRGLLKISEKTKKDIRFFNVQMMSHVKIVNIF